MKYNEIDWARTRERQQLWLEGKLNDHIIQITTADKANSALIDSDADEITQRPHTHEDVKRWFMDPMIRMQREMHLAEAGRYYGDAFPTIDLGRINLMQSVYYGAETEYTHHTIYVKPMLKDSWDNWEERVVFSEDNETFQLTLKQADAAMEIANGNVAITMIGGFEGPLDNTAAVRGTENALFDVMENKNEVMQLERRFLDDFTAIYSTIYKRIQGNDKGVCLWDRVFCVNDSAHCMQSDFSCMLSTELYKELGSWYLKEQSEMFDYTIYHLDGANAAHHIPLLASLENLNCIQFIHNHHGGDLLTSEENLGIIRTILDTGKNCEVFTWNPAEVIPLLQALPGRGLKIQVTARDENAAEELEERIRQIGYLKDYK